MPPTSYGYTRQLGYHSILAVRSDTAEVLRIRNRKGKANPQRGAARFVDELLARVRRAGHTGPIIIRADIGFENHKQFTALDRQGVGFSIGVKQSKTIRALIAEIPVTDWVTVSDYPEGGQAQVVETRLKGWRVIVCRTRLIDAQADLFPDWRHHCFVTNRTVPTPTADIDHRDHATIELVIRDLKDQALKHFRPLRRQQRGDRDRRPWRTTSDAGPRRSVSPTARPDRPIAPPTPPSDPQAV